MRIELDPVDHDDIETAVKDAVRLLTGERASRQHFLAIQQDGRIRGFYYLVGIKDEGAYELAKFVRRGKTVSYTTSSTLAGPGTALRSTIDAAFVKVAKGLAGG